MIRWCSSLLLLLSPSLALGATLTIGYTEPVVAGGQLDYCETLYCTQAAATPVCTPTKVVPNSQLKSDDGNGNDVKTLVRDVEVVSGQTHVTTATYCVLKNGNRGPLGTAVTCPGGAGCI